MHVYAVGLYVRSAIRKLSNEVRINKKNTHYYVIDTARIFIPHENVNIGLFYIA